MRSPHLSGIFRATKGTKINGRKATRERRERKASFLYPPFKLTEGTALQVDANPPVWVGELNRFSRILEAYDCLCHS